MNPDGLSTNSSQSSNPSQADDLRVAYEAPKAEAIGSTLVSVVPGIGSRST